MPETQVESRLKNISETELRKELEAFQAKCSLYRNGRNFGMGVYPSKIALQAYLDFVDTNYVYAGGGLGNPFAGVSEMEDRAIRMISELMHGDENTVGMLTFGGTESNILAMLAARDHFKVKDANIVMPDTAHPSLIKAAHLLGLKFIRTASDKDYRADTRAMRDAINEKTIAVVSTCGTHTVGTIDPIEDIARIAQERGIWHHVDAAWGGFISCFLKMVSRYDIPKFDFEIPGVWSITVDPHKMLFAPMPAGGILFKNKELQKNAFFDFRDELGIHGHYFVKTLAGSRSGGNIAATYALLRYMGSEGYIKQSLKCMELVERLIEGVTKIPGLEIPVQPKMNLFAVMSETLNVEKISEMMRAKGWHGLYTTQVPPSFRVVVLPQNEPYIDEFLRDLKTIASSEAAKKTQA
jgi:tyrosine decarboxylase MnfA